MNNEADDFETARSKAEHLVRRPSDTYRAPQSHPKSHPSAREELDTSELHRIMDGLHPEGLHASPPPKAQRAKVAPVMAAEIDLQAAIDSIHPAIAPLPARPQKRLLALLALCVVAALICVWVWTAQNTVPAPQDHLQRLAAEVESYRTANKGQLPESLAQFPAFPKGAIEWPAEYWNARSAVGHDQVIWIPQSSGDYRILWRQGSQSWLYASRNKSTKPINVGRQP
jgi:hypothetical protein